MKLLALDTATEACSAAVLAGDEIIERFALAPRGHAELILPMIEAVLAEAGLGVAGLDAVAFGRGPGAFTGVRIATGVVQGIAFAADLPVAPISTLAAIARQAMRVHGVERVAAAIDARMGEVYWGSYVAGGDDGVILLGEERVRSPADTPALGDRGWLGAGSGWLTHGEVLSRCAGVYNWWGECYPRAGDIAALGALAWRGGETVAVDRVLPVYLRDEVVRKGPSP